MKVEVYKYPKSSFLAVEKDMNLIVDLIMKNERLKKLIFYDVPNALQMPNVPDSEAVNMFGKQIKIVPKLKVDKEEFCYIFIGFTNFTENNTNPAFRDNVIYFDIVCHQNQWNLGNFKLRPYAIAAELDSMLNGQKLTGIGKLEFLSCRQIVLSNEFSGLALMYQATHGYEGEDSKYAHDPRENFDIVENFHTIFNSFE